MSIFAATFNRCVEMQETAAICSDWAMHCRDQGWLDRAVHQQRDAAYHSNEAMIRLFRLIGTE